MFVDYAKSLRPCRPFHPDLQTHLALSTRVHHQMDFSFLDKRQQRVKIGNIFSRWLTLSGGMPQGTWLGTLTFVILIDGLRLECLVHKFIDDTTASEILKKNEVSEMPNIIKQLTDWSKSNNMNIIFKRPKKSYSVRYAKSTPDCVNERIAH